MPPPRLALTGITKEYFGTRVLSDVSIEVAAGEIHALVGENGAGKSTLMNILFGMPVIASTGGYSGSILLDGAAASPKSPREALALGIGMVHQEFMLLPGFTVTENIKLNRERTRPNIASRVLGSSLEGLDRPAMREDARTAIGRIGIGLDEGAPLGSLPVGHWQFVEIAREIDKRGLKVLVFDEPTAVLTETEAERLLSVVRHLAAEGLAILFITHRLGEVKSIADRVTVLRDGQVAGRLAKSEIEIDRMAELMVGRVIAGSGKAKRERNVPPTSGLKDAPEGGPVPPALVFEHLSVDMTGETVRDVSLRVEQGEIFGIAGLAGQGKLGIANGLFGLFPARGSVTVDGRPLALGDPRAALKRGLAFVSEDRRQVGLLLEESIERNVTATAMVVSDRFVRAPILGPFAPSNPAAIRAYAEASIREFDIRCTGPTQTVRRLSGGNQQKVCLARAAAVEPRILFVSEPTRGIDVGAKALVLDYLTRLNRERGVTVVMASSELAELRRICDRIAVISGGRVAGILAPDAPDVEFGRLMGL